MLLAPCLALVACTAPAVAGAAHAALNQHYIILKTIVGTKFFNDFSRALARA